MSSYSDDIAPPIHRVCSAAAVGGSPTLSAGGTSALPPPARAPLSAGPGARYTARSHALSPPARAPSSAGQGTSALPPPARAPLSAGSGARCTARSHALSPPARAPSSAGQGARCTARYRACRPPAQKSQCGARARRLLGLADAALRAGDAAPAPLLQASCSSCLLASAPAFCPRAASAQCHAAATAQCHMSSYSDDIAPPIHRVCSAAAVGGSPTLSAGGTSALPPPAQAPLSAGSGARCTARSHALSPPARAPSSAGQGARCTARYRACRPPAQESQCGAHARRLLGLADAALRAGDAAPAPLLQARTAAGAAPRAASVFCGGGGSGLGLEAAGFNVVLGIDNNAKALRCFKRNHPRARALNLSVASVLRCAAALRAANVVLADCSAPCQGWSTAGHQRAGDKRNQLTVRAAEVFALVRVPVVLFENVPRSQRSPEWKLACDKLRAAGYSIDTALVDASRLGVPQRRVRMFAVATQPGFGFDLAGPAKVVANSARTTVADVMPDRRHFYHLGRGKRDPCVFSSTVPSPTLRTNCDYHPGLRHRRRARDSAHIRETSPFSLADLRLLQGWPTNSFLPERRRDAARILGNSVAPPVTAWLGSLARIAITAASGSIAAASARVAAAIRTPADLRFFQGAAQLGWGKRALERFHAIQAAQRGWGHGAVQRMIEAKDASVPGAHTGPLPGTANPHILRVHSTCRTRMLPSALCTSSR